MLVHIESRSPQGVSVGLHAGDSVHDNVTCRNSSQVK